jgi:hypothetical protein
MRVMTAKIFSTDLKLCIYSKHYEETRCVEVSDFLDYWPVFLKCVCFVIRAQGNRCFLLRKL